MKVSVRVHGYLEDKFRENAFEINGLRQGTTLRELVAGSWSGYGLSALPDQCIITVNYRIAQLDQTLKDGDVLDILPPAVGG
ncbi:MAG TPA: hypothetical protein GXX40_02945 [Firmicutes bacterium]|nr:hypothetical protein [Bacillota bacterium]